MYFKYRKISLEQFGIDGQKYEPPRQMQGRFRKTLDIFEILSNKKSRKIKDLTGFI